MTDTSKCAWNRNRTSSSTTGGDLVGLIHTKRPDLAEEVWGGCEETTTGVIRLKAMEKEGILKFPMVAVNDADCKHLFDNRYGTGQSVWDSIMRNTNLIVASKTVVVVGYGWCSRGIAMRAAALGSKKSSSRRSILSRPSKRRWTATT